MILKMKTLNNTKQSSSKNIRLQPRTPVFSVGQMLQKNAVCSFGVTYKRRRAVEYVLVYHWLIHGIEFLVIYS